MMRKVLARLAAVVLLGLGVLAGTGASAHAAPFDLCTDAPQASMPDKGSAGFLAGEPSWDQVPDVAPNPFAPGSEVGIADVYGYNFEWDVYDLGCGSDVLRDPQAVAETASANTLMQWPTAWAAAESRLQGLVTESPMAWAQGMVASINNEVADKLWNVWFPVTVVAAGGWVIIRSRRAAYAESAATVGVVVLVAAASVFLLNFPVRASNAVDSLADNAAKAAAAPFGAEQSSDAIVRSVLYPQWQQGAFGSATSPTAVRYGPEVFWATHYTWSEYKQVRADPKNRAVIDERKAQAFERVAEQIETTDPVAYDHLTGKDSGPRVSAALMSYPFILASTVFMMVTQLMLGVAKAMLQAFVIAAPVIGIFAVHPRGRRLLMNLWDLFSSALIAAIKFAFLGGLFALFLGAVLSSGANPVTQLFWLVLITVVAFAFSRPFKTLKSMTPGLDPNRSYLRDAMSLVSSFGGARAGALAGSDDREAERPVDLDDTFGNPRRSEDDTLGHLTPPAPVAGVNAERGASAAPGTSAEQLEPAAGFGSSPRTGGIGASGYSVQQLFSDDEPEQRTASFGVAASYRPETGVVAAPTDRLDAHPGREVSQGVKAVPGNADREQPLPHMPPPTLVATGRTGSVQSVAEPPSVTLRFPSRNANSPTEPWPGSPEQPSRPGLLDIGAFTQRMPVTPMRADPSGGQRLVSVPSPARDRLDLPDEGRLYHHTDYRADLSSILGRSAERQLDAEGVERYVVYRSGRDRQSAYA